MTDEVYQIEAHHEDWVMILGRALSRHNPTERDVQVVITSDSVTRFTVRRDFISAAELAAALGSTEELVTRAKRLVLNPLPGQENWEKPTVHYLGTA